MAWIDVNAFWECPKCGKFHKLGSGSWIWAECGDNFGDGEGDYFYLSARTLKTFLKRLMRMGMRYFEVVEKISLQKDKTYFKSKNILGRTNKGRLDIGRYVIYKEYGSWKLGFCTLGRSSYDSNYYLSIVDSPFPTKAKAIAAMYADYKENGVRNTPETASYAESGARND